MQRQHEETFSVLCVSLLSPHLKLIHPCVIRSPPTHRELIFKPHHSQTSHRPSKLRDRGREMQHLQNILQVISNSGVEYPLWEDAGREAPSGMGRCTWIHLQERLFLGRPNWA